MRQLDRRITPSIKLKLFPQQSRPVFRHGLFRDGALPGDGVNDLLHPRGNARKMGGFVNLLGGCGLREGSVLQSGSYKSFETWWPGRELNPRRKPFQYLNKAVFTIT